MKKTLLTIAAATLMGGTALAQWQERGTCIWQDMTNYGHEIKTNANGVTYGFFHGVTEQMYPMYINVVDRNGQLLTEGQGLRLCQEANKSYTVVNQDLAIDVDGNAIVSVPDMRTGLGLTYTIYKVGPDGKLIWGDKMLNGGMPDLGSNASMHICPTSDGGVVFAYETYGGSREYVAIEKFDKDGNSVWRQELKDPNGVVNYSYPYLVDCGDNQTMLFYMEGAGYTTKARLLDFDGENAWGDDVVIYRRGFGSMSPHLLCDAGKGPEGAVFTWMNSSATSGSYENRMCYILKDDGSYAFSDGEGGTLVSNQDEYSKYQPNFYWDEEDEAFYCVYGQFNQGNQSFRGIFMQKMSREGELLWGPNGKAAVEMHEGDQYHNIQVRDAGEGQIAVFYQNLEGRLSYGDVHSYMTIYDKDGNIIGERKDLTPWEGTKNALSISPLLDGNHYIIAWSEGDEGSTSNYYVNRINLVPETPTGISEVAATADCNQRIYDLQGRPASHAAHGIFIQNGRKVVK